jgi:hypothetical protein
MSPDDYLNAIESVQRPLRDAMQQYQDLDLGHLAEQIARDTMEARRAFERQIDMNRAIDASWAAYYIEGVDQHRRDLNAAMASSALAGRAFDALPPSAIELAAQTQAMMPSHIDDVFGIDKRTQQDWTQITVPKLSEEMIRGAHLDAGLAGMNVPLSAIDAVDFMKDQFEQISKTTSVLKPLETLSVSLYDQFGSGLTAGILQQELDNRILSEASEWQRAFHSLASLASEAPGSRHYERAEESNETAHDKPVVPLDAHDHDIAPADIYPIALRFALPAYELQVHLARIASRIDPSADGTATWERMILAIAGEHPAYAPELARIAYPLLQRLMWPNARPGKCVNGSTEVLSLDDAMEFEELAHALLLLLKVIEQKFSD